ncbi:MAG: hypothetical protein Q9202_002615 [Teloschistes flavicans]
MTSSIRPTTLALATEEWIAYAVYFDHKRRTDPEFRKALKRESRRIAKAEREEAEEHAGRQKQTIRSLVSSAQEEGFPSSVEDKETYFMTAVGRGESLCQNESTHVEAAFSFYKALKVYPQPGDLITIYDKTVPKPVLDILADMVAIDGSLTIGSDAGAVDE